MDEKQINEQSVEASAAQSAEEATAAEAVSTQQESTLAQESPKPIADAPAKKDDKKVLVIIAVAVLAVSFLVGGILLVKNINQPSADTSESAQEAHGEATVEVIQGEDATQGAEIKSSEALETIRALPDEKLGLKKEDFTFMVAQQAYVIDGEKYVQVIAAQKEENEDGTFSITPYGKYYISFDGKTILAESMENPGTYSKIK